MTGLVMGVVNVTPDSFSDGGRFERTESAVAHARRLIREGAAIIDIGGESTRPGAAPVDEDTEIARVVPVIEAIAGESRLSVDTRHARVARAAVAAGATLINDVSASLFETAAELGVGWVAMHMLGTPETMQSAPEYDDVVVEVGAYLEQRAAAATAAGVDEVWIDPGIGFGKTIEHNLKLLGHIDQLVATGLPVLVGVSRKAVTGALSAGPDGVVPGVDDRLEASLALATWAFTNGVAAVRAHDVLPTVQAAKVVGR